MFLWTILQKLNFLKHPDGLWMDPKEPSKKWRSVLLAYLCYISKGRIVLIIDCSLPWHICPDQQLKQRRPSPSDLPITQHKSALTFRFVPPSLQHLTVERFSNRERIITVTCPRTHKTVHFWWMKKHLLHQRQQHRRCTERCVQNRQSGILRRQLLRCPSRQRARSRDCD